MADPAAPLRMSADEYLVWEREQTDKHEFHDGEVFAMAGGSDEMELAWKHAPSQLRA